MNPNIATAEHERKLAAEQRVRDRKLARQKELVVRHRTELQALDKIHAEQLAELRAAQEIETRALERRHRRQLAILWADERRPAGKWMAAMLEEAAAAGEL